ncbi:MAG: thiol:disulfide interchange protein DsbA/DsbL [Rubrivivax sp.]|nr:thiol:disulfide interchange protein DsbA/DsbL [Rubrivivax sp.]
MNRRDFSMAVAGTGLAGALPAAQAQAAFVEGTHFVRLQQPAPVSAPAGKIEVVEFFWYGCPHCNELEPALEDWIKRLPADVAFRRVPVGFAAIHEAHQRLFYGLEAMGKLDQMHKRIFAAMHVQRQRLDKEADTVAFLNANGVDGAQWAKVAKEFHVVTKCLQAKKLSEAYKIDGVPAIGVHGRFYTAGSLAGDNRRALAVADFLIQRVKRG